MPEKEGFVLLQAIQSMDAAVSLFLQEHVRCALLNPIMVVVTTLGSVGLIWILTALVLMCFRSHRREGFGLLVVIGLCWCLNDGLIKNLVCRPRPFLVIPELEVLVKRPTSWSFPSGHSCSSFAASYYLSRTFGKKGAWAYLLAVLIAFSRVYVGVHFLTDILVGAVVGTIGSIVVTHFYPVVMDRLAPRK
jgi:undecaprenyl-diphosphatase